MNFLESDGMWKRAERPKGTTKSVFDTRKIVVRKGDDCVWLDITAFGFTISISLNQEAVHQLIKELEGR
jgi:hypothetical protein